MNLKLDHINMSVKNLDESVEWYGKIFGMEIVEHGVDFDGTRWAIVARNDSMICMNEYRERRRITLAEREQIYHINHFGIRITDEDIWRQKVKNFNLKLYYGGINEYPHSRSWYVKDPSGHTIEVSYTKEEFLKFPALSS